MMNRNLLTYIALAFLSSSINAFSGDADKATKIEAQALSYDNNKHMAIAVGQVKVVQGNKTIISDEAIYLKDEDKLYAKGHVAAYQNDGFTYFADVVNLEKNAERGKILGFAAKMDEKGLLASHGAEIKDKKHANLYSMVYSLCKVCNSNLRPNVPLWQMRATEAKIDLESEKIVYKNARIELHGVPVIYSPYFSMPTPGAKRKTGFLSPSFSISNSNGNAISLPFYMNIAPNKDLTYTPVIYFNKSSKKTDGGIRANRTAKTPIHVLEFRHLLNNGAYTLAGSIMEDKRVNKNGLNRSGEYLYGHINSKGDFYHNEGILKGDYGFQIQGVRDPSRTYAKRYSFMDQDILTSKLYHNKKEQNYYIESQIVTFQDLRDGHSVQTTANALPYIQAQYQAEIPQVNATMINKLDMLSLQRLQGYKYQRTSLNNEIKKKMILPYGQVINIEARVRGDVYKVGYNKITKNGEVSAVTGKPGDYTRFHTQLKLEWLYPLMSKMKSSVMVVEPVMQFIISPRVKNNLNIPNEDSQDFEISAANLFSDNRYLGVDRIETGNRLNYGVRGVLEYGVSKRISFLIGQSYYIEKSGYSTASGLQDRASDYVSQIIYEPLVGMKISQRSRFDKDSGAVNRNEIGLSYGHEKWNFSAEYSGASRKASNYINMYRHEIGVGAAYNIYDAWWINAGSRRKLGKKPQNDQGKGMIYNLLGLNYKGECLNIAIEAKRDYTKLRNLVPSTTYMINLSIPTM